MKGERRTISPFVPLLISLALVAGLFIGHGASDPVQGRLPTFLLSRSASADQKIDQVLDLIDRQYVDTVQKEALVDEVIEDILQRLDPHSYYITADEMRAAQEPLTGSFDGIGVEFAIQRDTVVVMAALEGGPSEALGIRAGDRIVSADGRTMAGVNITNQVVMDRLRGPSGSMVTVGILRRGRKDPFDVEITRGKIPINSIAASLYDPDGTGYVKLVRFARTTHEEFVRSAQELLDMGMKRLVLDLRGNGGGYLNAAIDMADEFLPEGRMIVYTEGRAQPRQDFRATDRGMLQDMPLAILIDEGSASASEILAGAVQDNDRGSIIGRRSFGKGLVQEQVDLPDHSAIRLTTARYYTPSGRSIQRPYGAGIDYADDLVHRVEHGELVNKDSILLDTSHVYHTLKGRNVYGGGGIMPDMFVAADTSESSSYLTALFFSGILNDMAFDVADERRPRLERMGDVGHFISDFRVDDGMLDDLAEKARAAGINPPSGPERYEEVLRERLKALIARNIFGAEGYYRLLLQKDPIFDRARQALLSGGVSAE
ncbi:MAG: S41 family peptidase [Flavobacteriales bacterium]|nr:S41 family peptidase [Flavobacteriales bacterium]MCB9167251.1 S41 family peptidase [Flavobacteriales bacterium]